MMKLPFDLYPCLRPVLFSIDPEIAHRLAVNALAHGLAPEVSPVKDKALTTKVFGLDFANPIGLGAGFDKHAEAIQGVLDLGFGFVELGTVVPLPQAGNPKPRMFRAPEAQALINRFGFNSEGLDKVLTRVIAFCEKSKSQNLVHAPIGINVGTNKNSADIPADYVRGIKAFAPYADYLTINISSPNTPGLRDMQRRAPLLDLLKQSVDARAACNRQPPLLVKIAPDLTDDQMQDIADVVLSSGIDGIIISNTTISRPASIPADLAKEAGGLSGKPLFEMSTKVLAAMYQLTGGKIPLVGGGGVFSGTDAYAKIRAGASLVQIYTAMVYEGPCVVAKIASELASLLKRDGFTSIADAVGADCKK